MAGSPSLRILAFVVVSMTPVASVVAQPNLSFNVGLTEEYTDNSNLSPTDPESDLITTPRFGLRYVRRSGKTDASVAFQVRREIHKNETQDDRTFPSLNARVNWRIIRERFTWLIQDIASQNQINVEDAPTTDNTQNVNAFLTGPDAFFRFGRSATAQLGARFAKSNFEFTDEDSTRSSGFVRFLYEQSALTTLSFNYDFSSVNFVDPDNSDFDRQDFFFRARTERARANATFNIGATLIDREDLDDNKPRPLFNFSWRRELTRRSTFGLSLARVESDTARNLFTVGTAPPNLGPGGNVANTPDVFTDNRFNLFYSNNGRRTNATVRVFARDQDYRADDRNDQLIVGTSFNIGRSITPRLRCTFRVQYSENEFTDTIPTRTDRDTDADLNFSYRVGRWLSLRAGLRWRDRDSTSPTQDYTETRAILGITYARTSL